MNYTWKYSELKPSEGDPEGGMKPHVAAVKKAGGNAKVTESSFIGHTAILVWGKTKREMRLAFSALKRTGLVDNISDEMRSIGVGAR